MNRRLIAAAIALALIVVGALAALQPTAQVADHAPRSSGAEDASVGRDLARLVSVFARPRTVRDAVPHGVGARVGAGGDRQRGEAVSLSRRLALGATGVAYVWPMRGGLCYASPGPWGCFPLRLVQQAGVVVSSTSNSKSPTVRLFGIARDGVRAVRITLEDGRRLRVRVRDNAFLADVSHPARVSWRGPDGSINDQVVRVPRR